MKKTVTQLSKFLKLKASYPLAALVAMLLLSTQLNAQFAITGAGGGVNSIPLSRDVVRCVESSDATSGYMSFRATATASNSNPVLTVDLATGVRYVEGTIELLGSQGVPGAMIIPINIGSDTMPSFQIIGDFDVGDFVRIRLQRVANCTSDAGGGNIDEVTVGTSSQISTDYDIREAVLSVTADNPVTTNVGEFETVMGNITNGGNGCIDTFVLEVVNAPGLITTALWCPQPGVIRLTV